jgi:hypothetical protein
MTEAALKSRKNLPGWAAALFRRAINPCSY